MPKPKTKAEDIIDKDRYIRVWLRYEKLNFHKRQFVFDQCEFSMELAIENDKAFEYVISTNKNGEYFDFYEEYLCASEWIENMENSNLQSALNKLTKHQQEILFLLFNKDLSQKGVSEKLGVSSAAISIQVKRIFEKIKKFY